MNYYTNLVYANERLRSTIVGSKVGPVYVKAVGVGDGNGIASVTILKDKSNAEIPMKDIDLTPVQLGYVNMGDESEFFYRIPIRAFKQGLSAENFTSYNGSKNWSWPLYELHHCIVDEYPSYQECALKLKKKKSIAFCREFSMTSDHILKYCGRIVGTWDQMPTLNRENQYLTERLKEKFR
jgi:hypothetical protein